MVESVAHMATRMPDLTGLTWQIEKAMSDSTMACSHNIAESSSAIIHRTYTSQPPAFHSSRHKMSDSEDGPECIPQKDTKRLGHQPSVPNPWKFSRGHTVFVLSKLIPMARRGVRCSTGSR